MQGSSHFRHQADTCFRLSASCTDQRLANRFRAMAQDFLTKAANADVDNAATVLIAGIPEARFKNSLFWTRKCP